ncbi:hypothetical protein [Streptomyces sp. NPDC051364]
MPQDVDDGRLPVESEAAKDVGAPSNGLLDVAVQESGGIGAV